MKNIHNKDLRNPISKGKSFEKLNITDEIYNKIRNYLNEKEEIKKIYDYNPQFPLKRNIIMIIIEISVIIIFFFLLQTSFYTYIEDLLSILLIISVSCVFFLFFFQLFTLIIMKKDRNKLFIFTNQKIIDPGPRKSIIINYKDISFINRRNFLKKMYLIEIYLKKHFIGNSDFISNKFVIPVIPYKSDLITRLRHLIEEETKKQISITFKRDASIIYKKYI